MYYQRDFSKYGMHFMLGQMLVKSNSYSSLVVSVFALVVPPILLRVDRFLPSFRPKAARHPDEGEKTQERLRRITPKTE